MALSSTNLFAVLTTCNKSAVYSLPLLSVKRTLSCCRRCFPASAKLTVNSIGVNNYLPSRRNLFSIMQRCEQRHRCCMSSSIASLIRTVHSGGCLCLAANWVTRSKILNCCGHAGDASLERTAKDYSATSKRLHNSRIVGLNQSYGSKNCRKWSISRVVRQLVCHYFIKQVRSSTEPFDN